MTFRFYRSLSGWKKYLFLAGFVFLLAVGSALLGTVVGLLATTFIPMCDGHSCLAFRGMYGYEAAAFIGFRVGLFVLFPVASSLIFWVEKEKRVSGS